jgi:NAD(P)-dependent dehydrogenase (short-subunit alcohol dehydrogenase family)
MTKNKIVIVTGGASGIGAATVKAFIEEDAFVVVGDVVDADTMTISDTLSVSSENCIYRKVDVTDSKAVKELIEYTSQEYGRVDVLVNNAGIGNDNLYKTAEHTIDDWHKVINVNQNGVFYGMKYALIQMMKQGYGNIVNVSSLAGIKASGKNLAYTASKFAVVGMTKSAALEYGSKNIRINCVCPGYTNSSLLEKFHSLDPSMHDKLLRYVPMKRYGEPEEIADAITWLASDKSKFITGQSIIIDGGISL